MENVDIKYLFVRTRGEVHEKRIVFAERIRYHKE